MSPDDANPLDGLSRRRFLANGAMLGTWLTLAGLPSSRSGDDTVGDERIGLPRRSLLPEHHILSACLQCNTGCGIRAKLEDGIVRKIDGSPFSPWTMLPHLPFTTSIDEAAPVDGALCPKGQSGLQTAYDPYRIRKVLKRAGRRGENRWMAIPFDQAIEEIVAGGRLFGHVPGEEDRLVEGLAALHALNDGESAAAMAADVEAIWAEKDPAEKRRLLDRFKRTHGRHLDVLIDPDHPDLGPRNNQLVLMWGRLKDGRGDLYKRFAESFGTVNAHGHTTVCQGSLYFTCKAISEQYLGGKFTDGKKFYWQADTENSRFILFVGANLFEGNYGPPNRSLRMTENLVSGRTRIAVVDPRFSKLASKAWRWLPVEPGRDGALAMGFIRWMLEEGRFDRDFLATANRAAATVIGETSWTNASLLVRIDEGKPGPLLRAADVEIGGRPLAEPEARTYVDPKSGHDKEYEERFFVALVDGTPTAVDLDGDTPVFGDLFVDVTLDDGTSAKSGLQLLLEAARQHSLAEWADIAGVRDDHVVEIARELTSHGKAAAVDIHRGVSQHTNGFYNVLAWMTVNMLLGNFDAKGGVIASSTFDTKGKGKGELFDITKVQGKRPAFGISSIRHGIDYEKTSLFEGYPARRNWYPLASDVYEEIIPSIGDAYPYPVKALILYMGAPTYALPAGHTNIEILTDVDKLPLFVASDILIGPTSMYADYLFPDLTFLERWEFQGSQPNIPNKVQPVRQPVIAPIPEETSVFGHEYPISLETLILGLAERLQLPGFGTDAFGEGLDLRHPDDLYLRQVANLAFGEKPDGSDSVPDADDRELEVFLTARRHLPPSVFDPQRWEEVVGRDLWRKVVYVLNRGGRFEDHADAYDGDRVAHPYRKLLNLYQEKTAKTIHAGTGQHYPGHAVYVPVQDYLGVEPAAYREGFDLTLITHRVISQTKSRTVADPWLSALMPENGILANPRDLARLGLQDGQSVKVVSATNPQGIWQLGAGNVREMVGNLLATEGIRPGVVSFALGFGHWATGASDITIDGIRIRGDERRQAGIHANAAMWTDPTIGNTCLFDPIGGSVSFYDTRIRLEPV